MKLVRFETPTGPRIGGLRNGQYVDLNAADPALPTCMKTLLSRGKQGLRQAEQALQNASPLDDPPQLLPPIRCPGKVICVGLNYADHARESGMEPPAEPVIFNKFPTTLGGHGDPVALPRASRAVDYEAELVVVMAAGGRHIAPDRALRHVAGYTCGNDISARDWQLEKPGGQWLLGKSFDSFAPTGPVLVTADEIPAPGKLAIRCRLNGQTMQDSNTDQLIFSVAELIAYISDVCTLEPGDLIFTGTPPGVGMARRPPVYLKPGDTLEVEIERIGVLTNPVIAERSSPPDDSTSE